MTPVPTAQDVLRWYMNDQPVNNTYSSFTAGLRDARRVTGRNEDNGQKIASPYHGSWLGAIGYLCLVDHISYVITPRVRVAKGGPFVDTLMSLTDRTVLSEPQAFALYALRCSFAHEFALVNVKTGRPDLTHNFIVTHGRASIVTLPAAQWDGVLSNRSAQNLTYVDLEALGDMVEGICRRLREMNELGTLHGALRITTEELWGRYAMAFGPIRITGTP